MIKSALEKLESLKYEITEFKGVLYTSQNDENFELHDDKATFFCIEPELCILATGHQRYSEEDNEDAKWDKRWWYTYEASGLHLLKYDVWIDKEVRQMPEHELTKMVEKLQCDGWMVTHKADQNSFLPGVRRLLNEYHKRTDHTSENDQVGDVIYPTLKDAMYEIAVFPHARQKLKFKEKTLERDFFRPSFRSKLRQGVLPLVRRTEDEYEEEIKNRLAETKKWKNGFLKNITDETGNLTINIDIINELKDIIKSKDIDPEQVEGMLDEVSDNLEDFKDFVETQQKLIEKNNLDKFIKLRF